MTPEQLDEIERLAEAATPGPWAQEVWQGNDDTGGWAAVGPHQESTDCICEGEEERTACAGEFCADDRSQNDEEQALEDAAFIRAMREHALPLVKALREARAALDQVSSDDRMSEAQILATIRHAQAQKDEAIRQRDEARAEVERLREAARQVHARIDRVTVDYDSGLNLLLCDIRKITKGMVE